MKKNQIPKGWQFIKQLSDGQQFQISIKGAQWNVVRKNKKGKTVTATSEISGITRDWNCNKLVYVEY